MPSKVYNAMRDYQRVGALWGRNAHNFALTDQPGLGKTIQTLGTILATAKRENIPWTQWHLVASPKVAVKHVWEPEIIRWLEDQDVRVVVLSGTLEERNRILKTAFERVMSDTRHVFVLTNIESVRIPPTDRDGLPYTKKSAGNPRFKGEHAEIPALFDRVWDTVVVDESHRALIRTSGTPTQTRGGFLTLKSRRRIALSGTPMRGKPEQMWGTLNWLEPKVFTSFWKWVGTYWDITPDRYSDYNIGNFKPGGEAALGRDLKPYVLRRTKGEVVASLPPKQYAGEHLDPLDEKTPIGIWLDMKDTQEDQIRRFEADGYVTDGLNTREAIGPLAIRTRLRQMATSYLHLDSEGNVYPTLASPKFDWLLEWLQNSDGEKIVVASQFTKTINVFAEALKFHGYDVVRLTGETSDKDRAIAIDRFQNGDAQVFFLNTKAGGVALTLDAADYLVFLDETESPDDTEQVEDRVHRVSRDHQVTIYFLRTLGTVEEEIAWVAAAGYDVLHYILDGTRGIEYAKSLFYTNRGRKVDYD